MDLPDDYTTLAFKLTPKQVEIFAKLARDNEGDEPGLAPYWAGNLGGWVDDPGKAYHHLQLDNDRVVFRGDRKKFFTEGHARTVMEVLMQGQPAGSYYPEPALFLCDDTLVKTWWQDYRHYLPYGYLIKGDRLEVC